MKHTHTHTQPCSLRRYCTYKRLSPGFCTLLTTDCGRTDRTKIGRWSTRRKEKKIVKIGNTSEWDRGTHNKKEESEVWHAVWRLSLALVQTFHLDIGGCTGKRQRTFSRGVQPPFLLVIWGNARLWICTPVAVGLPHLGGHKGERGRGLDTSRIPTETIRVQIELESLRTRPWLHHHRDPHRDL